jgi:ubiquinone/menaquinone biosynthesis C-methylase UbiE
VNCDRIARIYRWLEYLGFRRELERRRFRYLADVANSRKALLLGEGDGRFLARLARECTAEVDCVDSSPIMLALARQRAGESRIRYVLADARTAALPNTGYDLVVTHFFLDCFNSDDLARLFSRVAECAVPHAKWVVSEFRQPLHGWRGAWAWIWLRGLYSFFGVATGLRTRSLTDHHPLFAQNGFRIERQETSWFGLLASELWQRDL